MLASSLVVRAQLFSPIRWMTAASIRLDRKYLSSASGGQRVVYRNSGRIYVDVSVISRNDAGTGIQRVTRSIARELLSRANGDLEIIAVSATRKRHYSPVSWPAKDAISKDGVNDITGSSGDVFLGLDLSLDSLWVHRNRIRSLARGGMRFWYVMYDLLPHRHPQWFSDDLVVRYRRWLRVVAGTATGFFCISQPVADDLREWLVRECKIPLHCLPRIEVMPMGWEVDHAPHSMGVRDEVRDLVESAKQHSMILMVGTIEPRKGHEDIISAFDILWREGEDVNLVIVGRPGWKTEQLQHNIRLHSMSGKRLIWLQNATDEELKKLYQACFGVICASHAEGYGLPVIEALGHHKPVLARDIDVFRMFSMTAAISYFPADATAPLLAKTIRQWLLDARPLDPRAYRLPTWQQSADFIINTLWPTIGANETF